MSAENGKYRGNLVPTTYLKQANDSLNGRENLLQNLLQHRKLPETGWKDDVIEYVLMQLSAMDSNNFISNVGLGEREARIASSLVAKRHYYFGHGIGRSGDLSEPQPKAAGSSLLYKVTNQLLSDLFKLMGINEKIYCLLAPVATGMSIVLCLLAFKLRKPNSRYVVWSRIDQKSCFKSIIAAGLIPIIVEPILVNDTLKTDIKEMEKKILEIGVQNICCVISTTSCFAPRNCDEIEILSQICKQYDVNHLINNAYGLQNKHLMNRIQKAHRKGRIDAFVQSTDKNLLVPVGGAIIASFDEDILKNIANTYPGRASSSPIVDVFITLLSLGKHGYLKLVEEQILSYKYLHDKLLDFAKNVQEEIIECSENPISIAITLKNIDKKKLTMLGSMLFMRNVSGCRVVTSTDKTIDNYSFKNFGSHCNSWNVPYLTAASAIGVLNNDIDIFVQKLAKAYCNSCTSKSN